MVGQRVFTNSFDPNIIIIFHHYQQGSGAVYKYINFWGGGGILFWLFSRTVFYLIGNLDYYLYCQLAFWLKRESISMIDSF